MIRHRLGLLTLALLFCLGLLIGVSGVALADAVTPPTEALPPLPDVWTPVSIVSFSAAIAAVLLRYVRGVSAALALLLPVRLHWVPSAVLAALGYLAVMQTSAVTDGPMGWVSVALVALVGVLSVLQSVAPGAASPDDL